MNDLELITVEKPGVSSVKNFDELKSQKKTIFPGINANRNG